MGRSVMHVSVAALFGVTLSYPEVSFYTFPGARFLLLRKAESGKYKADEEEDYVE